jgi:hypothetical protein
MKIEVDIQDCFLEQLKDKNINYVVNELISQYLSCNGLFLSDSVLWKKHIELKISQLQSELDQHRKLCKCEPSAELDTNLTKRLTGQKTLLDSNDFLDLQQSPIKSFTHKNKPINTGNNIILDKDFNIPL